MCFVLETERTPTKGRGPCFDTASRVSLVRQSQLARHLARTLARLLTDLKPASHGSNKCWPFHWTLCLFVLSLFTGSGGQTHLSMSFLGPGWCSFVFPVQPPRKEVPRKKDTPTCQTPRSFHVNFCRPGMWLRSRATRSRPRCLQWHSALNELFRPQLAWQTLAILQHLSVWKEPHVSSNKFHAWRADFASACALAR